MDRDDLPPQDVYRWHAFIELQIIFQTPITHRWIARDSLITTWLIAPQFYFPPKLIELEFEVRNYS